MNRERINIKLFLIIGFVVGLLTSYNIRIVEAATGANDRNIQITRDITLTDVEDFEGLEKEINNIQGVVIFENNGGSTYSQYRLLIPREHFDQNLEIVLQYGTVESDLRNQTDITNEVTKLEKSIISNEEHKKVIMSMIEKAKTVDAILDFEQYLMEVEIEQTNNQNKLYELNDLSKYTTLYLWVGKSEVVEPLVENNYISRLGFAFTQSFTNTKTFLENILIVISYVALPLVFIGLIALAIFRLRKRGKYNEE